VSEPRFHCPALEQLVRQVAYAPVATRRGLVRRSERLHDELENEVQYPAEYVLYRVTGQRDSVMGSGLYPGAVLRPDLRRVIDALSREAPMPWHDDEEPGPPRRVETLAREVGVAARTVHRWRPRGLRWRWARGEARAELVIPASAWAHFQGERAGALERARRFQHMDASERTRALARAEVLARERGFSLTRVARRVAAESGRSFEAIRQLLLKREHAHPADPWFPARRGRLTRRERAVIARAMRRGVSAERLARRYGRSRAAIHRARQLERARAVKETPLRYHHLPTFERHDADAVLQPPERLEIPGPTEPPTENLGEPLNALFGHPSLSREATRPGLLRFNFVKWRAAQERDRLDAYAPSARALDRIEADLSAARVLRRWLFAGLAPEVLQAARRQRLAGPAPAGDAALRTLLEIGSHVLLQALEAFDPNKRSELHAFLHWQLERRFAQVEAPPATEASAARTRARIERAAREAGAPAEALGAPGVSP
jgi:hypothetical protein